MQQELKRHQALLIVDLQEGVVDLPPRKDAELVINNSMRLSKIFNDRKLLVVVVNVAGRPEGVTEVSLNNKQSNQWGEVIATFNNNPSFDYISKRTWGAFSNPELDRKLKSRQITDVYITGIASSMGVDSTARQAFELGYNVIIVEDAIADAKPECHQFVREHIFPQIALLKNVNEVEELLQAQN